MARRVASGFACCAMRFRSGRKNATHGRKLTMRADGARAETIANFRAQVREQRDMWRDCANQCFSRTPKRIIAAGSAPATWPGSFTNIASPKADSQSPAK